MPPKCLRRPRRRSARSPECGKIGSPAEILGKSNYGPSGVSLNFGGGGGGGGGAPAQLGGGGGGAKPAGASTSDDPVALICQAVAKCLAPPSELRR